MSVGYHPRAIMRPALLGVRCGVAVLLGALACANSGGNKVESPADAARPDVTDGAIKPDAPEADGASPPDAPEDVGPPVDRPQAPSRLVARRRFARVVTV